MLTTLMASFPDDGASVILLSRAVSALVDGPSDDHPIWQMAGKKPAAFKCRNKLDLCILVLQLVSKPARPGSSAQKVFEPGMAGRAASAAPVSRQISLTVERPQTAMASATVVSLISRQWHTIDSTQSARECVWERICMAGRTAGVLFAADSTIGWCL